MASNVANLYQLTPLYSRITINNDALPSANTTQINCFISYDYFQLLQERKNV